MLKNFILLTKKRNFIFGVTKKCIIFDASFFQKKQGIILNELNNFLI